jgi:CIC family chloride channel protein
MTSKANKIEVYIHWLHKRLTPKQFLIFSSILVGLTAGLMAILLKTTVHYIRIALTKDFHLDFQQFLYLIFPTIGILLTGLIIRKYFKGKLQKGTESVLFSIVKKGSFLPKHLMYSNALTSAITVGFGGSVGLESPIVTTGSAIGSNYSRTYRINYKDRTLLLACGAAAGIGAAFNAPIAGVLFALEVLLADVSISAFIPLIISAATGALLSKIILKEEILLSFKLSESFDYHNVPFYIVLGILAGVMSVYYLRVFLKIENKLQHKKWSVYSKALVGGLALSVLILIFPPLFGEGYESIKTFSSLDTHHLFAQSIFADLINNKWAMVLVVFLTMLFKPIAAALTVGSGGNGGNFAPSLFVGAFLGFGFSVVLSLLGFKDIPVSNFTLVAMAGILSGVFHAPLTAIFLIAELTGGYELMIPLMIVSAFSFMIARYFEPHSLDVKNLAKKGYVFIDDKDKNILASLKTMAVIEQNFQAISPDASLGELIEVVAHSKRNIFPVVEDEMLVGIILLDDIREIMFKQEMYESISVRQLMHNPPATISSDESIQSIMKKFDETNAWNLPVIDEGKYIGFVSKSSLLVKYREKLIQN